MTAPTTVAGRHSQTGLLQGVLNDTLSELLGEKIETIGASRTDAGGSCHGKRGSIWHQHTHSRERFPMHWTSVFRKISAFSSLEEVEPDFHPRYCDSEKTYEYRILNRKFPVPTERLYTYFYHYKLDVDKMKQQPHTWSDSMILLLSAVQKRR